jgi:hypothetical protein
VIGSDLLVETAEAGLVTYPDGMVICGETQFVGKKRLIFTLQEYLLVATDEYRVDVYTREADGRWSLR